jgi:hypothetical protein
VKVRTRMQLRSILEEEVESIRLHNELKSIIKEALLVELSAEMREIVKQIQRVVYGLKPASRSSEDDADTGNIDGAWGGGTDGKWFDHLSANADSSRHGEGGQLIAQTLSTRGLSWPEAARAMSSMTGQSFSGNPRGALAFLEWLENPPAPISLEDAQAALPIITLRSGSGETAQDVEVSHQARRQGPRRTRSRESGRVHVLTPVDGERIDIPDMPGRGRRGIWRIKVYFNQSLPLTRENLNDESKLRKIKINNSFINPISWLRVREEARNRIVSLLDQGLLQSQATE